MIKQQPLLLIKNEKLIGIITTGVTIFLFFSILNLIRSRTSLSLSFSDLDQARKNWIHSQGGLKNHFFFILSIFIIPYISISIAYWNRINKRKKLLLIFLIFFYISDGIRGGSRSGIYSIFTIAFIVALSAIISKRIKISLKTFAISICLLLLLFLSYCTKVRISRNQTTSSGYVKQLLTIPEYSRAVKKDHPFLSILPDSLSPGIISATYYLGHGYDGLARCLEKPFQGVGWGMGSSTVVLRNISRFFKDKDLYNLSYFYRLQNEDGFSRSLWITMYPWIASDFTFTGSIVFLYFLGWLMGACWMSSLKYYDPIAAICLSIIFSTMMHCHNNFSTGDYVSWILFWGSVSSFIITRRYKFKWAY
ncbi:MAG: hypothetical protein JW715_14695 [Sedimentisphaerales bacterium]|nr:hypothetical protein [Sedimentisphaerales bacterium]